MDKYPQGHIDFLKTNFVEKNLASDIRRLLTFLLGIMQIEKQFLALTGELEKSTDLTLALNDATLAGGQGQEVANSALTQ